MPFRFGEMITNVPDSTVAEKREVISDGVRQLVYASSRVVQITTTGRDLSRELGARTKQLVEQELQISKNNKLKLLSDWRTIMRITKVDELRKQLDLYFKNFERELDNKDAILQMLDNDIEEAEEQHTIALRNNFIHIDQLMSLQLSRISNLEREFKKDVKELHLEFEKETKEINENFVEEKEDINQMTNALKTEFEEKKDMINKEFKFYLEDLQTKIKDKYNRVQEDIRRRAESETTQYDSETSDIKQKTKDKSQEDSKNIEEQNKKDKEIAKIKKEVDLYNEDLKQLKIKIKQNFEDWETKNKFLTVEKEKIRLNYKILKDKLKAFRHNNVCF